MACTDVNDERYVDYLDFSTMAWTRPESPPRVWRIVEGRKKLPNGEIPKFSIQEVSKELEEDVIDFMVQYFIVEEPINADLGTKNDALAIREFRTLWKDFVRQGVSVVALTVNSDPSIKPVIAGVNMLSVVTAADEANFDDMMLFKSECMMKVMAIPIKLLHESNVLGTYGVDKYLSACGLCVQPSFRGHRLGEELLRVRDDIGLAYQIPVSETLFTATASQILAARVGYEVILERKYSELLDDEGKIAYPGVTVEFIKVMAKKLY